LSKNEEGVHEELTWENRDMPWLAKIIFFACQLFPKIFRLYIQEGKMSPKKAELSGINAALDYQEKTVKELEDRLFLEQIRLASLKAARESALRRSVLQPQE
jgi:hypothetical protein